MLLSSQWISALSRPGRRVLLVSLVFARNVKRTSHLALDPDVLRSATDTDVHVTTRSGRTLPFWGRLAAWPVVSQVLNVADRRAEIASVRVALAPVPALPAALAIDRSGELNGWGRIDFWTDGILLEDALPLAEGPMRLLARGMSGAFEVEIRAGEPADTTIFPAGEAFTPDQFPQAPQRTWDYGTRALVVGAFERRIPTWQVDRDGLLYYVAEPPLRHPPSQFFVGGTELKASAKLVLPRPVVTQMADRTPYSALLLPHPVEEYGLGTTLSCAGGTGIGLTHPLIDLLEQVGGYTIEPQSRSVIMSRQMRAAVFKNASGSVWELAANRLAPQLGLALTFDRGRVRALSLAVPEVSRRLQRNSGLRDIELGTYQAEAQNRVKNLIRVDYGKDVDSGRASGSVLRRPDPGDRIGRLLLKSAARYGVRFLQINAGDVTDEDSAWKVANLEAEIRHQTHRTFIATADYLTGFSAPLGTGAELTDDVLGLTGERVRVVAWRLPTPAGPVLECETVDL